MRGNHNHSYELHVDSDDEGHEMYEQPSPYSLHMQLYSYNEDSPTATSQFLPDDALINIFSFLPVNTITDISLVCKDWFQLCELNVFWKPLFDKAVFKDPIPRFIIEQDEPWLKRIQERFDFSEQITMATITGGHDTSWLNEQISEEERQYLGDRVEMLMYEKHFKGKSMHTLRNLSTPLFYKSCFFYLHGYKNVGTTRFAKEQQRQLRMNYYNEKLTSCGTKYLVYAVVPISTLFFTLFFIALLLKETVGKPFVPIAETPVVADGDGPKEPKYNYNLVTDYWWSPVFLMLYCGLGVWYMLLAQINLKHVVRYFSNIKQNYKVVSYGVITFCYATSVLIFSIVGNFAMMFPYDPEQSTEKARFVWLRKISHSDWLLLSPIIASIILVNVVWPLIQFTVYVIRNRSSCITLACLRRSLFQIFIYVGGLVCMVLFIGLLVSDFAQTDEEREKGGSKITYFFQIVAFVPIYAIQLVMIGLFMLIFYRMWYGAPLAIRTKVRTMCVILTVLMFAAVGLVTTFELMLSIMGLNVYVTIPLIPLPTVLCAIFYSLVYLKKVIFG